MKINQRMTKNMFKVALNFLYLIVLAPLVANSNEVNDLAFINGTWKCVKTYSGGSIQTEVISVITYNVADSIYVFNGMILFKAVDSSLKASIESSSHGQFSYADSKLSSRTDNVDIRVISDELGIFSAEALSDLKEQLTKSNSQQYITKELNENYWRRVNPKDGDILECDKES